VPLVFAVNGVSAASRFPIRLQYLAKASFKNVSAAAPAGETWFGGVRQPGAAAFPRNTQPSNLKNNQGRSEADNLPRYSPNPAIRLPKGSDRSGSTSDVLHARAQLHRCMLYFFPACAESDSSDDSCENDSALHASSPKVS
jgi:hypothetical protein